MSSDDEKYPPVDPDYIKLTALSNKISEIVYPREGHDYNTSCDAMWQVAVAAFEFAAHEVGASGFQGSMAALHFYGQVMHIDGPYMIVKLEDALFPQYDKLKDVREWMENEDNREWLRQAARKKIAQYDGNGVGPHPNVLARWEELACD